MSDPFRGRETGLESPADSFFPITPGPADLSPRPRAIRADSAGTVTMVNPAGQAVTLTLQAGELLPVRPVRITAASATLLGLV